MTYQIVVVVVVLFNLVVERPNSTIQQENGQKMNDGPYSSIMLVKKQYY